VLCNILHYKKDYRKGKTYSFFTNCDINLFSFQLGLKAYDSFYPKNVAYANITFNILRNENSPIFKPTKPYTTSLSKNSPLGTDVYDADATDNDKKVMKHNTTSGFILIFIPNLRMTAV
jgi:hypothetical protein